MPARRSPTTPLIRASVISSFSASGVIGRNSPRCAERGGAGFAVIHTLVTGAPGGCAANSNCNSFRNTFESRMATGRRKTRSNFVVCHIVRGEDYFLCSRGLLVGDSPLQLQAQMQLLCGKVLALQPRA